MGELDRAYRREEVEGRIAAERRRSVEGEEGVSSPASASRLAALAITGIV